VIAFDESEVRRRLKTFISTPIRGDILSDPYTNPTYRNAQVRANNSIDLELEARLADDFFQKICALQPANPSKLARVAKLNAGFEDAYNHLENRLRAYSSIREELENALAQNEGVAFVGRRGSGKTTILNKWLNERTPTFFESEKGINYIWFRIDASKIYNANKRIGVKQYYTAHSVFVFLLYSGCVKIEEEEPSAFFKDVLDAIPSANRQTIDQFCVRLQPIISRVKKNISLGDKSVAVVEAITSSSFFLSQAEIIYGLLVSALEKRGTGTVAIIDGIDNISYSKTNLKYQKMCSEMKDFFRDYFLGSPNLRKKLLVASRPETIPELEIRAVGTNHKAAGDFNEVLYRTVHVPVVTPMRVLQKKIDAIKRPEFETERRIYLDAMRSLHPNESDLDLINSRTKQYVGTNFERLVCDEMNEILSGFSFSSRSFYVSQLDQEHFLGDFFDGDVRAYLAAFRRIAHGKRYYVAMHIDNVDSIHLIPEIFVLSGRVYKTSAFDFSQGRERYFRPHNADLFPNVFWYEAMGRSEQLHQWHGLCGLRLLQLARARDKRVYELAKLLHSLFDYPYDVIEEVLQTFIAYGLINVEHDDEKYLHADASSELFALDNPMITHRAIISTTKKGRICATLSLTYFKWLYFLALDTPLLKYFLPETSGDNFIRFYKSFNKITEGDFNFWDAVIPTSAVLLKHITHFHASEMAKVKDRCSQKKMRAMLTGYGGFDALANWFALPERGLDHHVTTFTKLLAARSAQANRGHDQVGFENVMRIVEESMTAADQPIVPAVP
jgi:hypothetical protein